MVTLERNDTNDKSSIAGGVVAFGVTATVGCTEGGAWNGVSDGVRDGAVDGISVPFVSIELGKDVPTLLLLLLLVGWE